MKSQADIDILIAYLAFAVVLTFIVSTSLNSILPIRYTAESESIEKSTIQSYLSQSQLDPRDWNSVCDINRTGLAGFSASYRIIGFKVLGFDNDTIFNGLNIIRKGNLIKIIGDPNLTTPSDPACNVNNS